MGYKKGSKTYRRWHRRWMRKWRRDKENREHEQMMDKLRGCLLDGTVSKEDYLQEVWHPWKSKVLR